MRKKVGLFTLGITLILAGTIIILNRYTQYQLLKDTFLLWPAFLIMLGLEFIISKLYYDYRHQDVQLSPSGFSIFLAIVVLAVSFFWTNTGSFFPNFNFNFNNDFKFNQYSDFIEETYEPEAIQLTDSRRIDIDNIRGSIEVQPSDSNKLKLEARIRIATNDKEKAAELIKDVIRINTGSTVAITSSDPGTNNTHSLQSVNMTVYVPKDLDLNLKTAFGAIIVSDMDGSITIDQKHSSVDVGSIGGSLKITGTFGDINVDNISGDLEISNTHGTVDVKNIGGKADIENSYDSTKVKDVKKDVTINSIHGLVRVENIGGSADIENQYNDTECTNIKGDLKVRAQHSEVNAGDVSGNIDIETSYDTITVKNKSFADADINAQTSYNSIKGDDDINLDITDESNFQKASAVNGNGSQKIRLKNHHGAIRIEND